MILFATIIAVMGAGPVPMIGDVQRHGCAFYRATQSWGMCECLQPVRWYDAPTNARASLYDPPDRGERIMTEHNPDPWSALIMLRLSRDQ